MGFCFACFGGKKAERREQDRLASAEARGKAAEAAQKRQEEFEKSAAGRAARAQLTAMAKKSTGSNNGEPVLKIMKGTDRIVKTDAPVFKHKADISGANALSKGIVTVYRPSASHQIPKNVICFNSTKTL